jgi:phosphonate transport system substrate-binding protein
MFNMRVWTEGMPHLINPSAAGSVRRPLRVASCMAPNADDMCCDLVRYLSRTLEIEVEWVGGIAWNERERLFDAAEVDLCWICGLPYADKVDAGQPVELCVAPVMRDPRYGAMPVYFSDIVVRYDSPHVSFADLMGAAWAYNEPRSHSGYNTVRYHLATLGRTLDFFGRVVATGAHQASLSLIVAGEVAAAAVDSTVLEAEVRRDPSLSRKVRVIETLGPSPAPPWVFSHAVSHTARVRIRRCLAHMHRTREGAAVLAGWGIGELRVVDDGAYDAIRRMARISRASRAGAAIGSYEG